MRRTRASPAQAGCPLLSELLEHVMGLMHPRDVARAALVSRDWGSASRAAMRPAFTRLHDPARAGKLLASLGPAGALARLEAHAAEAAALPGAAADVERVQGPVITEAVRAVATEWLIEVCWDWKLESTTVFTGVRYLDLWLATTRVGQLSRFQGIAISCLRAAFQRSRDAAGRRDLSRPAAWADVCDGAATAADVSAACRAVAKLLRGHAAVRTADTPKLQLRRLWYQLLESGTMSEGRVRTPPSLLATGALALALDAYGFDPFPARIEARSPLLRAEVDAVAARLAEAQARTPARQLRLLWATGYNYEASSHEWLFLRAVVSAAACDGGVALASGAGRRGAAGAAVAQIAAAAEALAAEAAANGAGADAPMADAQQEQQQQQQPQQQAQAEVAEAAAAEESEGEVEQPLAAAGQRRDGAPAAAAAADAQGSASSQGRGEALSRLAVLIEEGEAEDSGASWAGGAGAAAAAPEASDEPPRRSQRRQQQQPPAAAAAAQAQTRQLRQRRQRQEQGAASGSGGAAEPARPAAQARAPVADATPGPSAHPLAAALGSLSAPLPFAPAVGIPAGASTPAVAGTPAAGLPPRALLRDETPGLALLAGGARGGALSDAAAAAVAAAGAGEGGAVGSLMGAWQL
ncbi:hypothetical protein Rsub_01039 [Raphidocelis subcapitata]|uniref:Cyclin N-terminal domain-containing protein n=1 Tax=Raphidocelis subcapitata TaxID=307507 RepID=A0A2V0NTS4_9CHLO|nr:hypothetical protein Rsub_01039 [Raphidocelis subcapitata]|eukprot:GBF88327.1 hypothetical protein Rsub_01039 [Raphidocelis subcapitata]